MQTALNFQELLKAPRNNKEYYVACENGIQIEVFPSYIPDRSDPENNEYFFACRVVITNENDFKCTVLKRSSKIKSGDGKSYEYHGNGIYNVNKNLEAGERFEYVSIYPFHSAFGNVRGKFQMEDEFGNRFWSEIPLTFFRTPETFE